MFNWARFIIGFYVVICIITIILVIIVWGEHKKLNNPLTIITITLSSFIIGVFIYVIIVGGD